jgi:DNA-binding winged helix-turn-helix (wHTH) protein/TolB-like protein/Tfp pilus assembly protein PilF
VAKSQKPVNDEKSILVKRFYEFGPFRLDLQNRLLWRGDDHVPLTIKAFDTLLVLVESGGGLIGKDELMSKVWPEAFVEDNNLAQQISFLRRALNETESGVKYIETIPKRGYRFVVATRQVEDEKASLTVGEQKQEKTMLEEGESEAATDVPTIAEAGIVREPGVSLTLPATPGLIPSLPLRITVLLATGIIAVTFAVGYFIYSRNKAPSRASIRTRTLAILPFRNLKADADTDFLGVSLADAIITKLDYVSTVIVRPSSYVEKYRNRDIDAQAVAAELNVNTLLTGSFIKEGDDVRINAQLIDVETNEILWSESIDLKYDKLLTLQDRVARQVIDGMKLKLSPSESERLSRDQPHNAMGYEYYLRGIDLYSKNEFPLAVEMFKKSVALDSAYALAWAHLGTAYTADAAFRFGGREDYQRALDAYQEALTLNPEQIEARIFMANMFTDTNRVSQAVPLLREVLKTNPNYALAHWELGYAYRFTGMLDESIAECERARTLDPQVKLHSSALNSYLYAGQYDKFLHTLPPDEDAAFIVFYRGLARLYLKDEKGAATDFDRAYRLDPSLYTEIGKAVSLALGGESRKGRELLKGTEAKMDARGVTDAEAMYKIAQAYAVIGDKASALRMLSRSIEGGFFCYPYIKDDPLLDNLRQEAGFAASLSSARKSHEDFKSRFF